MMLPSLSCVSVTDLTVSKAPASSSSAAELILQLQRDTQTNSEQFHSHRCSQVLISLRLPPHQMITIWCVRNRQQSGLQVRGALYRIILSFFSISDAPESAMINNIIEEVLKQLLQCLQGSISSYFGIRHLRVTSLGQKPS